MANTFWPPIQKMEKEVKGKRGKLIEELERQIIWIFDYLVKIQAQDVHTMPYNVRSKDVLCGTNRIRVYMLVCNT